MKLNLSLVLFLLFMALSSHNANSKEPANSAGGSLQEVAIDLYVDTQTKQIYSEPGAGRVRMGSFQKIADTPAQQTSPAASSGTPTTDNGTSLKQSQESKQAAVSIPGNQKTGESPRGFGYANWKERDPFKFNLNEDGSQYIKFGLLNQTWLRYEQNNPGSLVLDKPVDDTTDIGLRRTRLVLQGQLTDRVYFYTQYGMNNFNFLSQMNGNRHIAAYFHDAFGELRLTEGHQAILGGGLTIANGLSRFSNPSAATSMTMDLPIFAQATVDQTDLFSRKLSLYLRGQVGKFNYRVIASDPFSISTTGQPLAPLSPDNATFANNHTKQYQGFFVWNFWDTEPMTNTFMQGTYLGKKSVLNLEAGFITQKNATSTGTADNLRLHDINFWSVAAYLDAPVDRIKETAISAYLGYFNLDYGPGYIRNNGAMNPASDTSPMGGSFNGPGNAFPMFGTGDVWYGQLGYLMGKDLLGSNNGQLMPYVSLMSANYERLDNRMNVFNVGINWLIKGHTSKITFDYQNRPIFNTTSSGEILRTSSKGQFVLQYQIAF
ncbi:hypothetical protein C8R32_11536 [Nitrosospira sp. Nsp5]|uniref:Short chain amide porin n=1 Tax=Nitrosospira multiformis TaxID=1231 RepID=A0ABY0TC40_9PROT|nr:MULTISPECIES: hypothetical protein [Nitrosospira]PTR05865.1 hypothetical protein C8R32_11536 [Nitrosospira sp. Nsp5]SDQ60387.1 hypothetical protein SAMN05216402_1509 [Nitrosospira multiformis]